REQPTSLSKQQCELPDRSLLHRVDEVIQCGKHGAHISLLERIGIAAEPGLGNAGLNPAPTAHSNRRRCGAALAEWIRRTAKRSRVRAEYEWAQPVGGSAKQTLV